MRKYWSTYFIWLTLPFLMLVLTNCQEEHEDGSGSTTMVNVGDKVPDFSLLGLDGKTISSSSFSGQAYILNFFDTRCPDCQEEMQVLQQIYEKYQTTVPILNVPRSQTQEEVLAYWDKAGLSMPFYMPRDKNLYYQFANSVIPRTYVVDSTGKIHVAFSDSPIADYETLDNILQQLSGDDIVNLSLRINVPAARGEIDDYYFHNEYTVSRLDVYFFDSETKEFSAKVIVRNLTTAETLWDEEYDITYIYNQLRLRVGVYDIFAIANFDNAPDHVEMESDLLDMVDNITYSQGVEANIPDKGPVMTSRVTALLGIDFVPWSNKDYVLRMELERVMAKLQIGVSQNSFQLSHDGRKYAEVNITNYKLVNMNKCYYLFQHTDILSELTAQPEFVMPYNYSEYSGQDEQYVVDPLFYQKTKNASDVSAFRYNYLSWFGTFTTSDFASMPSADNHGYAYILENTSFKTSQKNGYSPGVVFKAAVNPVFVYLYDSSERKLQEEYRPEYWPKTIYMYKYNFYGSIQAVNIVSGLMLDELETYSDSQLKSYGIKQCKFNMGVYETFYTYWIRHRNSDTDLMGPMQYGVVRNNFYKMTVTGINGLGNSVITPEIMRDNYPNSYSDVIIQE